MNSRPIARSRRALDVDVFPPIGMPARDAKAPNSPPILNLELLLFSSIWNIDIAVNFLSAVRA